MTDIGTGPESKYSEPIGERGWVGFYRLGAITAFMTVLVMVSEIMITFIPGGGRVAPENLTVVNWFELFRDSWFLGLRNLGLVNIAAATLMLPTSLAVFGALRKEREPWAALGLILSVIGAGVYLAGNTGFGMLNLSGRFAAATTEAELAAIEAAGRAMLALGESHTPGTFLAFLFLTGGGFVLSAVMVGSARFGRWTAVAGLLGNTLLVLFEIVSDFIPPLFDASLSIAAAGGLLSLVWSTLVGRDLMRLARRSQDR